MAQRIAHLALQQRGHVPRRRDDVLDRPREVGVLLLPTGDTRCEFPTLEVGDVSLQFVGFHHGQGLGFHFGHQFLLVQELVHYVIPLGLQFPPNCLVRQSLHSFLDVRQSAHALALAGNQLGRSGLEGSLLGGGGILLLLHLRHALVGRLGRGPLIYRGGPIQHGGPFHLARWEFASPTLALLGHGQLFPFGGQGSPCASIDSCS
mmetsp:Transcript_26496/g.76476  ORF Transcript_26496/g.76476 Transcript_26496/m.76476 type:complete len:205 (+) Transcript_26496:1069-1683(+)